MSDNKLEVLDKMDAEIETRVLGYASHTNGGLFDLFSDVVYQDDTEAFKAMIESGADINMQNKYGWTLLHIAIRRDRRDMVEYLIANGADINRPDAVGWTPLMESIMDNMTELCGYLVAQGADKTVANQRGATAPMLAQKFGRQSMYQYLM